jgi:hypothetical protein
MLRRKLTLSFNNSKLLSMGYILKIGEYKSYISDAGLVNDSEPVKLNNAPAEYDHINSMHSSDFTVAAGLELLFNQENGLLINIHNTGDFVDLTIDHQRIINQAYLKKDILDEDHQCALSWLKFGVDWALANCQKPVIINL